MIRVPGLILLSFLAAATAQRQPPAQAAEDLVELDVVALDHHDQPVTDLRREDFTIKEDGHAMELKTFSSVSALGSLEPDDGRVVVLLMDDIGVPAMGTSPMQQIAPVVLSPLGDGDEVSVVRLASRSDEAFGDIRTARDRIAGYRGGAVPFGMPDTPETMLKMIEKIAGQLEAIDHRRKVILCLGLPTVCDVREPQTYASSVLWPAWVAAVRAAARANVSVYCVDPTGASSTSFRLTTGGLVQVTGGRTFSHQNDFSLAAKSIWREAGHYYLLGYWPTASKHELRSINVDVARKGVRVHAHLER
jgi:VWFA-related protein